MNKMTGIVLLLVGTMGVSETPSAQSSFVPGTVNPDLNCCLEQAPELGYVPIDQPLKLPADMKWGAVASIATNSKGHVFVFMRGDRPLVEFDKDGNFVRAFGEGIYVRPHGLRIDSQDNIWTADDEAQTVTKMGPDGKVLLTLGVKGTAGDWNEAANARMLNEPNDMAFGPAGEIFVVQGHGGTHGAPGGIEDPRVLKFDKTGKFIKSWGGKGTGPGQFNLSHSIVVDAKGLVYVADRDNRRIQIFDLDGKLTNTWKYIALACGLYIHPDKQMWMVTGTSGQIAKLDSNGKIVAATGHRGKGLGEFGEAHYMTFGANGELLVADTANARVHKFVKKEAGSSR